VNLQQGLLHVRQTLAPDGKSFSLPKTSKGRRKIRLTSEAVEVLKRHKVAQNEERLRQGTSWQDHGLVFPSQVGTPMNPDTSSRGLTSRSWSGLGYHRCLSTACGTRSPP
jgi:hypothetical protein